MSVSSKNLSFSALTHKLTNFWIEQGCTPYPSCDVCVGAGTFHPQTLKTVFSSKACRSVFVQPSRRPQDGRLGLNPNRLQQHHQLQVLWNPSPPNLVELMIDSLRTIGITPEKQGLHLKEDNWQSPTLGAFGKGWEVQCSGMEIVQFTYFQQFGGQPLKKAVGELTYGLERCALCVHTHCSHIFDVPFDEHRTYGDTYAHEEKHWSAYNHQGRDTSWLQQNLQHILDTHDDTPPSYPWVAYHECCQANHYLNILDARKALSYTQRASFMQRLQKHTMHVVKNLPFS